MGDEGLEHNPRRGPSIIVDGPEEMRKAVRLSCREGCDNIKLDVSGDPFYPNTPSHTTPMSFEEIKMAVDTAHAYGRRVNAHTRSIGGSKACLKAGVDMLYHCEYSDDERSEEHTSELQSLMRISYAVFCLKKNTILISKYLSLMN